MEAHKDSFASYVRKLQDQITEKMKGLDSALSVQEDLWERNDHEGNPGGGGRTRAFQGAIFENAGVNTSLVYGAVDPAFAKKLGAPEPKLWATGISLIIHPRNPRVPTVHANFRMIHVGEEGSGKFWFGGGADLTPFYPHEEDFSYFHNVWKDACSPWNSYETMKKTCDEYFVNRHRDGEMRGIGGIFFDHYNSGDPVKDMEMVRSLGDRFIESYFPIVEKRMNEDYNDQDEDFQLHRRGRYVEFNLLHDRGTKFGLETNGRTDSILISLPARCRFTYKYAPESGSPHEKMMEYYHPRNWA